jgi:acetylglutamate kinase
MSKAVVIKIGGNEIDEPNFLAELAGVVTILEHPAIIVHGGGKEISEMQTKLGIEPRYVDGVRITDEPSLAIVEMILAGLVNKRLVRSLVNGGINALGLSGVDMGIVRAKKMSHPTQDMGFTGTVTDVRGDILRDFLGRGVTPVIAPIALGEANNFNVNADHVAGAVAAAVGASQVVFLTNVKGVMVKERVVQEMTSEEAEALIADGTIFGGMIPKVRTALQALESGIPQAVITNLQGLQVRGGTVFIRGKSGSLSGRPLNEQQYERMQMFMDDYNAQKIDLGALILHLEDAIGKLDIPTLRRNSFLCHWSVLGDVHSFAIDQNMKTLSAQYSRLVEVCLIGVRELIQSELE